VANIIIWPKVFERFRRVVLGSSLLGVRGLLQREGIVTHVVAEKLVDLTPLLRELSRPDAFPLPDDDREADLKIEPAPTDHFKRPPNEKPRFLPDAPISQPDASRHLPLRDPSFPSRDFR
jgi:error-prone DNA polymerase